MSSSITPVRWVVLKFGGTSVATATSWAIIRDLVRARLAEGLRPVVVHSAVAGVSNQLVKLLQLAADGEHDAPLQQIIDQHLSLAGELGLDGAVLLEQYFNELTQLVAGIRLVREVSPRVHAKVMALGELMATTLGASDRAIRFR